MKLDRAVINGLAKVMPLLHDMWGGSDVQVAPHFVRNLLAPCWVLVPTFYKSVYVAHPAESLPLVLDIFGPKTMHASVLASVRKVYDVTRNG